MLYALQFAVFAFLLVCKAAFFRVIDFVAGLLAFPFFHNACK